MKNTGRRLGQAGFTLIEILVALILISLLVAAVFPVVTQQTAKADAPRLAGDLASIRTGMDLFGADMRNRSATDFEDLVEVIVDGTDDVGGRAYNPSHVNRWDGPYIDAVGGTSIVSGFGATIFSTFSLFDSASDNAVTTVTADADFVAIELTGLEEADFIRLNDLIDGEADSNLTEQGRDTGRLRAPDIGASASFNPAYYLAIPFR